MNYTLKNLYYTATVSSLGAELISLKSNDGYEFMWQKEKDWWHMQAPILFPLCGSFKNSSYTLDGERYPMDMHGFALSSQFTLAKESENELVFSLFANEDTKRRYPFDFELTVKYTLREDTLTWCVTVTNRDGREMPYMLGWHPGFNLPTDGGQDNEDYCLDFDGLEKLTWCPYIDEQFITDRTFPYPLKDGKYRVNEAEILKNDTMIFTGHEHHVKLYSEGHSYLLEMEWSKTLPTLCVWKQETHEAKMLCVEPWCLFYEDGITDDNYNLRKMPKLSPGMSETYYCNLKIRR